MTALQVTCTDCDGAGSWPEHHEMGMTEWLGCQSCMGMGTWDLTGVMLSTDQMARLTGVTPRKLRHWHTMGLVPCAQPAEGSGCAARWSIGDAELVTLMGQLPQSWDLGARSECANALLGGDTYDHHGNGVLTTAMDHDAWTAAWLDCLVQWLATEGVAQP